jgi:hypothetical protein
MTFDTSTPAGIDTLLAAYTGSTPASLFEVALDDDYGSKTGGRISFPVTAGTNYFITVASLVVNGGLLGNPEGDFTLSWYPTPAPGFTSNFRPATGTPGTKVTLSGTNFTGATAVLFNGASAIFNNALTNNLDLRITATVPPEATDGPITIRTPHGDFTAADSFIVSLPLLLAHTKSSAAIEISWAATSAGMTLETTSALDRGLWTAVTQPLIRTNGYTVFQPDVSFGNQFYRLRKQ